jgi:DNA-binding PadR family transcriptional regulator
MFGMRNSCGSPFGGKWAAGRGWRGRHGWGGRHGSGGRHGWDGDMVRAGRMLAQGDLRLIALALIAEQPRHGYEIIKVLEEKTAGWYSPSPGIVYPTLTYLEEAGYVTAAAEGAKKLYTITDEGRAYLDANRDFVDAVLERLAAIGEKVARMRRRFGGEEEERRGMPPLVRAALENLREVAAKRLGDDAEAEAKVVEVLARAAAELKKS